MASRSSLLPLPHGAPRLTRIGMAILLVVTNFVLAARPAAAAVGGCRSDPVLVVNGTAVDVVTTLAGAADAIRELDYTVTVPSGSLIGQTRLTVGIGFPESVTYIFSATQRPGTMRIDTRVVTAGSVAPFPTSVQATAPLAGGTASGLSSATITIELAGLAML